MISMTIWLNFKNIQRDCMKKPILFLLLSFFPLSSFADNQIFDVSYTQEKNSNSQPDWKMTELGYTKKEKNDYWQLSIRDYERYNLNDNEILFNSTDLINENEKGKTFLSYSLGVGDFNENGYLPEFRTGLIVQQYYKNGTISPIFDYKYSKYENSSINYFSLAGEKYIENWRILAGLWLSDSSFYKTTSGVKTQVSYYFNDTNNSVNYYFSSGKEPEVVGSSAKVYRISSHAITSKILIDKNLYMNFGLNHTVNHGNYSRTGFIAGLSYVFQ